MNRQNKKKINQPEDRQTEQLQQVLLLYTEFHARSQQHSWKYFIIYIITRLP